uniref:putative PDDEXK endonuclease n=1 Tax=Eubacterium sp. TaxID=142586 RepID=UPI003FF0BA5E
MNSRQKGAAGERELAKALRSHGFETRRGQQYCGSNGDADVVGLPGVQIECKRVERLNLEDAMAQSRADARPGEIPVVMHRKNNCKWLVTLSLDDFMTLYKETDYDRK